MKPLTENNPPPLHVLGVAEIGELCAKSHLDSFSFSIQRHLDVLSKFIVI